MSMTTEQREAIEILKSVYVNKKVPDQITYEEKFAISTVISSLQQKDKEVEKYKVLYERALSDLVKTEKNKVNSSEQ